VSPLPAFEKGQRVVVENPGPERRGRCGLVLQDAHPGDPSVHVRWDDGQVGWPLLRVLVRVSSSLGSDQRREEK
jgi:hypothetical protein